MAIGVNWKEVWADVWGPVWSQVPPEPPDPEPEQLTQTPAGSSRSKHKAKKSYFVEIDGQVFEVDGLEHAQALLDRAKEVARQQAPAVVEKIAEKRVRTNRPVHTPTPSITTAAPELRAIVAEARAAIVDVYRMAAVEAEIRLRLEKQRREDEDDEDDLLLLL